MNWWTVYAMRDFGFGHFSFEQEEKAREKFGQLVGRPGVIAVFLYSPDDAPVAYAFHSQAVAPERTTPPVSLKLV
jgi:hypothetical protein